MSDAPRDEHGRIASPCVRVCCLNDDNVCLGCFRRIDEITRWGESSDAERRRILTAARERRQHHYMRYPFAPH